MQLTAVLAALLAGLLFVSTSAAPPAPASIGHEARVTGLASVQSELPGPSVAAPTVLAAPAPRRVAIAEAQAALAPARQLAPRPVVRPPRRTLRRRIPRMSVDGAADH